MAVTRIERSEGAGRDNLLFVALAGSMLAVLVAVFGVGLGIRAIDEAEGGDATAGATGEPLTVEIELGDLFVRPPAIDVPAGTEVIVNVTNTGQVPHDLKLNGATGTELIPPGGRATASLGVVSRAAQAWCTVPGHKEAGMVLDIRVAGSAAGAAPAAAGTSSAGAKVNFTAEAPAAFKAYDPTLAPAPGGREHVLRCGPPRR